MSAPTDTLPSRGASSRRLLGPEVRRIMTGVVLIAAVLWGQQFYGIATASGRLDPTLRNATGPNNVIVVLDFMPERFHSERIREYGSFAGRDGALNRMRLRNVSADNLQRLASIPWVARIEPMK